MQHALASHHSVVLVLTVTYSKGIAAGSFVKATAFCRRTSRAHRLVTVPRSKAQKCSTADSTNRDER